MTRSEAEARQNFGNATVDAMHQLAELIYLSRAMREIKKEFKDNPDIDFKLAKRSADKILKAVAQASTAVLQAIRRANDDADLITRLDEVRQQHLEMLEAAISSAQDLADMEAAAIAEPGGALGNFIRIRVHYPLVRLTSAWR